MSLQAIAETRYNIKTMDSILRYIFVYFSFPQNVDSVGVSFYSCVVWIDYAFRSPKECANDVIYGRKRRERKIMWQVGRVIVRAIEYTLG